MKKGEAISIVNAYLNDKILNSKNTNLSKINKKKPVWWFNIPPERFQNDLNLLLNEKDKFIWLQIPANKISDPEKYFRIRKDKNLVDIEISAQVGVYQMRDVKSGGMGYNFEPHIKHIFVYN
ncbi:hypothetical protein [uncultured Lutibacter sp.]|uniref:hypothetical protein n=1 Tax=uncultured Lutibacter sp. TaxID=437739 RepID=UPI00261C178E|nr:hypothetical protein [uncultured Lutibacter sp.]